MDIVTIVAIRCIKLTPRSSLILENITRIDLQPNCLLFMSIRILQFELRVDKPINLCVHMVCGEQVSWKNPR